MADKRTARPCAEHGRKQAPSVTKNDVEAIAAAKWARTCVVYYQVYTYICTYMDDFFLCARSKRGSRYRRRRNKVEAAVAAKWLLTYALYILLHVYIPVWMIYFSLCEDQRRKQPPSSTKSRRQRLRKWSRTHVGRYAYTLPKQASSAATRSRQQRLRSGHVRKLYA